MSLDPDDLPPQTWAGRHAGTLIGAVLFALLAVMITVQVAC